MNYVLADYGYKSKPCKHGWRYCDEPCPHCALEAELRAKQKAHDASVRRQKSKLKIAPWRSDPNRPDYVE